VRADRQVVFSMTGQGYLRLPAAVRYWCGLVPGDRMLLAVDPADELLVVHPTTLTWVERNFGYAVARAYPGHTHGGNDAGTTTTYIRANIQEVAAALAALTSEPHPLA